MDESLQTEYYQILKSYVSHPEETHLASAGKLGKTLVQNQIPHENIVELHEKALSRLVHELPPARLPEILQHISSPLMELFISYDMAFQERLHKHLQAEKALRESEEKFRTLFEKSKDAIFISSPDGKILDINTAGVELFGFPSREELLNANIYQDLYVSSHDSQLFKQILEQQGFVKDFELQLNTKNGEKLTVLKTATTLRDSNNNIKAIHGIIRDITENKKLQEQLLHAQKMETIGILAGGIAHDFNNILTTILGNAEFGLSDLQHGQIGYEHFVQIKKAANKASDLTNQLLSFSRQQVLKKNYLNVNHTIDDLLKMLRRILGEDIELFVSLPEKSTLIYADPGQIQQILMNLFVNARDAMQHGGKLQLKVSNVIRAESMSKNAVNGNSKYVQILVSDNGIGIEKKNLSQIFDPFFTTKEVGKGTGLGLAVVYGIVKQHDGFIEVESEVGRGTTFRVMLPSVNKPTVKTKARPSHGQIHGNGETILLIEDDETVRNVTARILNSLSYKVITASNGKEACELLRADQGKIHLVILDVVMPGENGPDIYRQLNKINPNLPVLFVTGYDIEAKLVDYRLFSIRKNVEVLQKPYTKESLGQSIQKLLRPSQ
ncbi:MAG: ATP-binding protein [bacterium]